MIIIFIVLISILSGFLLAHIMRFIAAVSMYAYMPFKIKGQAVIDIFMPAVASIIAIIIF